MITTEQATTLTVRPIGGRVGAEISGVKLVADLPDETIAQIKAALTRYKVVFFRDQDHLDDPEQEGYAARFGRPEASPFIHEDSRDSYTWHLTTEEGVYANSWHTDVTFMQCYPAISVLRCVHRPPAGGDTMWANTVAAYEALPEPLKLLADNLWSRHSNRGLAPAYPDKRKAEREFRVSPQDFEAEHPLVRIHPVSGERSLVLGHHWRSFVGLNTQDSFALYHLFETHITRPENTVRWGWQVGDVAMWDNRATQHYAVWDYELNRREMHRVTVHDDIVPTSIDGRQSRQITP